jgi:enoyl-CoA hydratase/carnithine racemase
MTENSKQVAASKTAKSKSPVIVTQRSATYWRVTLDNPPINLFDPEMTVGLQVLMDRLDQDKAVKVVVFDSADPDYFISHVDLVRAGELDLKPGPTGLSPWPDVARRLELSPFITVALVRGRARGVGSEFLQAMDVRFASRERAILSQIELGTGVIPGGGGLERLPRLIGRARALEVIASSDDFDADTAERYGWVNRSIPDAELDAFVERFATRVASFDRTAIAAAKEIINQRAGLAQPADLAATQSKFFEILARPETQKRVASLMKRGLQQRGDFELRLGDNLGPSSEVPMG